MKKSRFSEEQIIGMIKEQEGGVPTAEVCQKQGISTASFYKRKSKSGGPDVSDARKLKALEALRGDKAVQEIAAKHQFHPNQIRTWKRQAIVGMAGVFRVVVSLQTHLKRKSKRACKDRAA